MRNIIGICNLHDGPHCGLLTSSRPLGTVSFLGRYALMDFALSNFSNSGIDRVGILCENDFAGVKSHIRDSQVWIRNTKFGFHRMFFNEKALFSQKFNTDVANILANKSVFTNLKGDYVVVTQPFFLMSYDFQKLVDAHVASGAEVTVVTKHLDMPDEDFIDCDEFVVDKDGNIKDTLSYSGKKKTADISLETFVFSKNVFDNLMELSQDISRLITIRKLVSYVARRGYSVVKALPFDGYVAPILSLDGYVKQSFKLLDQNNLKQLFRPDWPIYTTTHDTPPALYGKNSKVSNSFIANGSKINGTLKNCIISREVVVEEGAVLENCIVFTHSHIAKGTKMKYVFTDKRVDVAETKKLDGEANKFLYIEPGVRV